jgi:cytochrome c oxidase cbb3-type subunit 3
MDNKNNLHLEKGEKEILIDHAYDGIQELNNPLPSWWTFTFYAGIGFAFFYFMFFLMGAPTLREEFVKDHVKVLDLQNEYNKKNGLYDDVKFQAIFKSDGTSKGKIVFETNCVPCHKDKGAGDIGPNLTDEFWMWAKGTPESIYPVIFKGVPDNGMPTWSGVLTNEEIYQVVAYVQSLHNTHVPGGKAPQGNKVD